MKTNLSSYSLFAMGLVRKQQHFEIFSILDLCVSVSVQSKEVADEGVSVEGREVMYV